MRRVVRSAGFLLMSHGVSLASGLIVLALSARYLGVVRFGEQAVFRSIALLALPLLTGGLRVNIAKEIGRDPEGAASYLGNVLALRWALALVAVAAGVVVVRSLPLTPDRELAGYATVLLLVSGMWHMLAAALFVAYERTEYNLAMSVTDGILAIPLTLLAIRFDTGVAGILASSAAAPLVTSQIAFALGCRRFVRPKLALDFVRWRHILRDSLPVGVGALLRRSYARAGVLLLAALRDSAAAGVFSVAYRPIIQTSTASVTVSSAVVPRLSRLAAVSRERLRTAFEHLLIVLLGLSIPGAAMLAALALPVVTLVAGPQFTPSVPALRLVSIAIVTTVPGALLFFSLVALGKEGKAVRILATSVAGNVVLDVLLIPLLGVYGACLGALGAELIYFGLALAEIHRELRLAAIWKPLAKLGALVLVMGLAIHLIGPSRAWLAAGAALVLFSGGCILLRPVPKAALGALRGALATRADGLAAPEAADTGSME